MLLGVIVYALYTRNEQYQVIALHGVNSEEDYQLRVLIWNIHGTECLNDGHQEAIAGLIVAQNAEVVLLNEFTMSSCLLIDSLMSIHYPYTNVARAKVKSGDIIYSKIPFAESGRFKVKGLRKTIYSKIIVGADTVYIVGCHLAGNNNEGQIEIDDTDSLRKVKNFWGRYRRAQEKRKEHARLLKEIIQNNSSPMIVMGDMNDFQHSAPMDSLRDAGMKNAWWEGGLGYGATYHQGLLRLRIDHIYCNNKLTLRNVKVVETNLSDHNIMTADLSIAK